MPYEGNKGFTVASLSFCSPLGVFAHWDTDTDQAWFDWPEIERTAADPDDALRGMAKLLLAARESAHC